jgi:hypothetical protein
VEAGFDPPRRKVALAGGNRDGSKGSGEFLTVKKQDGTVLKFGIV